MALRRFYCHCPLAQRVRMVQGQPDIQQLSLESLLTQQRDIAPLTLFFVQANKIRDCKTCKPCFTKLFGLPEMWWSEWCKRLNGYFGCEATAGDHNGYSMSLHPAVASTNKVTYTWFHFLVKRILSEEEKTKPHGNKDYEWLKLNVFTRWDSVTKDNLVVVFDAKPEVQKILIALLPKSVHLIELDDPYYIHVLLAEAVLGFQGDAVWRIRNSVRHVEETRTKPSLNYSHLHDLARHAIHVFETLDLAARTFNSMIEHHDRFAPTVIATDETKKTQQHIHDRLDFYNEAIHGLRLRSISNKDRLMNEIGFSFNVVAHSINRAVQSDSSAMKTIALVSIAFFPMVFFATFFSMTFFVYRIDSGTWSISDKFWIYWAVSVPFTFMAAVLSYSYNYMVVSRKANRS